MEMRTFLLFVVPGLVLAACYTGGPPDPSLCATKAVWSHGDSESPLMHPGWTCIDCHTSGGEGPRYTIAGTVFPKYNELNDCNGSNGTTAGLSVVITDKNGASFSLPVNSVGNFFTRQAVAMPFTAKVVSPAGELAMTTPQTNGDCNSCHAQVGNSGAPGRIVAP